MPVKKIYTKAEAKSAIDVANEHYFGQLLRVRSDVTNEQFASDKAMGPGEFDYKGSGSDVGHAFRHVEATKEAGKSTFDTDDTLVIAVMTLLNQSANQTLLGDLDTETPEGGEKSYKGRSVLTKTLSGSLTTANLYGKTQGGDRKKVKRAMCIVQKLGASTLWVHTAYPTSFVG
jgi:hypothetical protein